MLEFILYRQIWQYIYAQLQFFRPTRVCGESAESSEGPNMSRERPGPSQRPDMSGPSQQPDMNGERPRPSQRPDGGRPDPSEQPDMSGENPGPSQRPDMSGERPSQGPDMSRERPDMSGEDSRERPDMSREDMSRERCTERPLLMVKFALELDPRGKTMRTEVVEALSGLLRGRGIRIMDRHVRALRLRVNGRPCKL